MSLKIALVGNPNSGKTTLFNALTGSNQFVGNWPGVTVEKKEGKLKIDKSVTLTDLPGIYSLSPYTLEEVVARNYVLDEKPDAILNIVDGTNLERNLYLTTQALELGVPVVVAINMMDVVKKNGSKINIDRLSEELGCKVVEISALKGTGVKEAAQAVIAAAQDGTSVIKHKFNEKVEAYLNEIEAKLSVAENQKRFYAIKLFERDDKIGEMDSNLPNVDDIVKKAEAEFDDSESIITNERYEYIASIIDSCYVNNLKGKLSTSDKIDRIVTNRWLGLPIFAVIMFLVYYISMVTVGAACTDWVNDGLFGDGWHLFGRGTAQYEEAAEDYGDTDQILDAFIAEYGTDDIANAIDIESEDYSDATAEAALAQLDAATPADASVTYETEDEETLETTEHPGATKADLEDAIAQYENTDYKEAYGAPDTSTYGTWVPGIPALLGDLLDKASSPDWLSGLILDGIVAGVGAVLGFVPQMLVLFIFLAFLEYCGYMARIAFIMDRIFRKFGLSGKSFIPILIGTGCGVPGIMASRTIENDRDRKMTIMTTTFIPCGAKLPIIAMIATALFDGAWWVAPSAYFLGIVAIIISGIILKKTKMFAGDPAPFVMELPAYHLPTVGSILRSMWERGWSFIKRAGTVILLASIIIWAGSSFGMVDGSFGFSTEMELNDSVLGMIGNAICWIFAPLGFGEATATIATIMGLVAKEEVVGVFGVLDFEGLGALAGYAFLAFNLLCAPCFAAIGAIKREMNSSKWTWFAIGYQCTFAYATALVIYQLGMLFSGHFDVFTIIGSIVAFAIIAFAIYLLVRPYKESTKFTQKVKINA